MADFKNYLEKIFSKLTLPDISKMSLGYDAEFEEQLYQYLARLAIDIAETSEHSCDFVDPEFGSDLWSSQNRCLNSQNKFS